MVNVTVSIPENLKERMDGLPFINWSAAIRIVIKKTVDDFEGLERIASKSKLSEKDLEKLKLKIDRDAAKYARMLLNEASG